MSKAEQVVVINGREVTLTNLGKVLWPGTGYTKASLIKYFADIYPYLGPYLQDRPLVVTRWPDGIMGKSFYQKNTPAYTPPWVPSFSYQSQGSGREIKYIVCNNLESLVWLGNLAALELHPWLSRCQKVDNPDFLVFDLDPPREEDFPAVRQVMLLLRETLLTLGLESYPKTSGAKGMHLYVPLEPLYPYHLVRRVARAIASLVVAVLPKYTTIVRSVGKRDGKIYVDYLQNVRGQTICAPYSPRPLPGAPVSTPLTWEEVSEVNPREHTLATVPQRLQRLGDPFACVLVKKQTLERAMERLGLPSTVRGVR